MKLTRQLSVGALALAALSCGSATEPGRRVSQVYTLQSIDGHPLPVVIVSGATTTVTAEWGTLTLFPNGNSVAVTHLRGAETGHEPVETDQTDRNAYRIQGDSIRVGAFSPCVEACIQNREGLWSDASVTLTPAIVPHGSPVYLYRSSVYGPD